MSWVETARYPALPLLLCGIGCVLWVAIYAILLPRMVRHRYVEIPAAAVAANFSWELVWGFVYRPDLGQLFTWLYRAGCLLDVVIVFFLFRWGSRQVSSAALRRLFRPALVFGLVAWSLGVLLFVRGGYDNGYGAISGYIINVQLSALYIVLFLGESDTANFSYPVAWLKMLGSGSISLFNFAVYPDPFLVTLCLVTLVLDLVYIALFRRRRREAPLRRGSP